MIDPSKYSEQVKALPGTEVIPPDENREVHVDGDYCAYYFAGNDDTPFGAAKANMLDCLNNVATLTGALGRRVIHLTAAGSHKGHRYAIATVKTYQGQRTHSQRPKNWEAMRAWMEAATVPGWKVKVWDDREADDGVACAARYALTSGRDPVIFSRDKDFRMIPGLHVEWSSFDRVRVKPTDFEVKGIDGLVYGQKWFWLQMLQGDTADNIPGLPGVPTKTPGKFKGCGEGAAADILAACKSSEEAFAAVREAYRTYYAAGWAAAFAEQAALLFMRPSISAGINDWLRAIPLRDTELERAAFNLERRINATTQSV